jgi:hypothetical protein
VRIRRDPEFGPGPWPAEPTATVIGPPETIQGRSGALTTYWVEFDEPQTDADGDGPFINSQVLEQYLEQFDS